MSITVRRTLSEGENLNLKSNLKSSTPVMHWENASRRCIDNELSRLKKDYQIETVDSCFNVGEYIRNKITSLEMEDPFYVVDVGVIKRQLHEWRKHLPRVKPFYAFKCNPHPVILRLLRTFGVGFDCASKHEIDTVIRTLDVQPSNIIFANPCKPPSHLRFAKENEVHKMTFDNYQELVKIKKHYPDAQLLMRILTDDSSSICRFGSKFGTPPSHIPVLLNAVKEMELNLVGVSFHVGSGCLSVESFADAVRRAHAVFDLAEKTGLPKLTILDIGGGFPGSSDTYPHPSFRDIAKKLNSVLDELFPVGCGVELIAEPGRYFAAESHTLSVSVFARRDIDLSVHENDLTQKDCKELQARMGLKDSDGVEKRADLEYLYYVNDGVYGSFNCLIFDHAKVDPIPLRVNSVLETGEPVQDSLMRCKIFGPTCDSLDCITKDCMLPKLEVGDWMYFKEMGAYTIAAGSEFNGFLRPDLYFVDSRENLSVLS